MEGLRAILSENAQVSLAIGGLVIGIAFGMIFGRTNYCTMGSLSDMLTFGDKRRWRAWLLTTATATIGAQLLQAFGVVDLSKSMYLGTNLDVIGSAVGGTLFGFGMAFTGGCASRNLIRAGAGDLRSIIVLIVMGIAAYATIGGIIGPIRAAVSGATAVNLGNFKIANQGLGSILASATGLPASRATMIAAIVVVAAILFYCFKDRHFRTSPINIFAGLGLGICAAAGWALTGLAYDEVAAVVIPPASLTFVRPTGDLLEWIQRYTAGPIPSFGVTSVFGTAIGGFIMAKWMGRFNWTTFASVGDTVRNLFGATLMGIGGVVALGCTLGQAVTGASTLALGSYITFAGIVAGGIAGIKTVERYA